MRLVLALSVSLTGCSSILGIEDFKLVDAGSTPDIAPDVAGNAVCLGPSGFEVCLPDNVGPKMLFAPINTTSSPLCAPQPPTWATQNQTPACFIFGSTIRIDGIVRVTGDRPLVLAALDTIDVAMPIDAASHFMGFTMVQSLGPGAPSKDCELPSEAVSAPNGGGGGGGAGGTFMGEGGHGGDGTGAGGKAAPIGISAPAPRILRAGCSGGDGGKGNGDAGVGGAGGGAVYLVAANKISVTSYINASGAAGRPGGPFSGGSGGGSGGMIMLHAAMIEGSGTLIANGGGGGGGSANNIGTPGTESMPSSPAFPPAGGGGPGGVGGSGAAINAPARPGESQIDRGGGGGGGAEGYIRLNHTATTLIISPADDIVQ